MANQRDREYSVEVFPHELLRIPVPDWKILLISAYDGPSTMYKISKKYGFKYSSVHRSTKSLEKRKWLKIIEERNSEKGGITKVYGLTLLGLLHLLYRIPGGFIHSQNLIVNNGKKHLPREVKTDLGELRTQEDVALHLLYSFKFNQVAENNRELLPLIFGKWSHFKDVEAAVDVVSSMTQVAHVTLGDYFGSTSLTGRGSSLATLFTHKVYYNLLKESLFTHYPRNRKGYEPFDYHELIQQRTVAVFKGDPQLLNLFKQLCDRVEKEVASLQKSIRKIKSEVLSL